MYFTGRHCHARKDAADVRDVHGHGGVQSIKFSSYWNSPKGWFSIPVFRYSGHGQVFAIQIIKLPSTVIIFKRSS